MSFVFTDPNFLLLLVDIIESIRARIWRFSTYTAAFVERFTTPKASFTAEHIHLGEVSGH